MPSLHFRSLCAVPGTCPADRAGNLTQLATGALPMAEHNAIAMTTATQPAFRPVGLPVG